MLIRITSSVATAKTHLVCDGVGLSADKIKSSLKPASLQTPSIEVWETKEDQEKPIAHVTKKGKTASRQLASKFAHISSISAADTPPIVIRSCFLPLGHPNAELWTQLQQIEVALSAPLGNTKELMSSKLQVRQGRDVGKVGRLWRCLYRVGHPRSMLHLSQTAQTTTAEVRLSHHKNRSSSPVHILTVAISSISANLQCA